jgi:hypothetical protein
MQPQILLKVLKLAADIPGGKVSMSTIPSSLPAGLQVLSNDGLLPSNLTAQQLQNSSPQQLTQLSIDNVELSSVASLFGGAASSSNSVNPGEDLVSALLGGSTASNSGSTDPILQAIETAMTNASNAVSTSGTAASTATSVPSTGTDNIGTLFNYMG